MKSIDDAAIVNRVLQGDESAFTSLVNKYRDTVHALAYHHVRNFHDAEDITQEVFIKAYRSLETLVTPGKFGNWLYRIVCNHRVSWLRRAKGSESQISMELESTEIASASMQRHTDDKLRESVRDAILALPENERIVINLYYLGGATSSDISRIMDVPAGTVRYWLHRAKRRLREELGTVQNELRMKRLASSFTKQVMDSLGKIEGCIIGMDGKPLGNIRLTLDTIMGKYMINSHDYIQVDGDGHFVVDIPSYSRCRPEKLDTVEYRVMCCEKLGRDVRHASTPAIVLRPGEKRRGVVLDLRKDSHTLRIRVVDGEGKLVDGAHVLIGVTYDMSGGHGLTCVVTGADGLTPSLQLSSCRYMFRAIAEGFAPNDHVRLTTPNEIPESGIFDITIEKGGRIAGKVVDSNGNPVANAHLAIRYYADEAAGHRIAIGRNFGEKPGPGDAQTGEDGQFAFMTLYTVGEYCIQAFHPDHGVDGKADIPVGSEDALFQLKPVVALAGKVLKGNQPVPDGLVYMHLLEAAKGYEVFENERIRPDRSAYISAHTDTSGTFRIPYLFPGCSYRLEVRYGESEYAKSIRLTSQPENHLTIHLD